jgi:hypothetical protein
MKKRNKDWEKRKWVEKNEKGNKKVNEWWKREILPPFHILSFEYLKTSVEYP